MKEFFVVNVKDFLIRINKKGEQTTSSSFPLVNFKFDLI